MSDLAQATYAFFALSQNLPLGMIEEGTNIGRLPLAQRHTPEWFAAAAEEHASLLDMAPELLVAEAEEKPREPLDLVSIYGEGETEVKETAPHQEVSQSESVRISLLRGLEGLDE